MKDLIHRGPYRNIKNGDVYYVIDIVTNKTSNQEDQVMILYMNGNLNISEKYVREIDEFKEKFMEII